MNSMERLTKTYSDGTHGAADNLPCGENSYEYKGLLLEALGKYEDAEEQGRMIIFPYSKGDKIFEFYRECVEDRLEAGETPNNIINMREVRHFEYDGDTAYICASQSLPVRFFNDDEPFCIPVSEIGKTVFLTREEAEAKLKEMEKKDV